MVVVLQGTGWKLLVEAQRSTGNHRIEMEQAFQDLACVAVADSLLSERTDFAAEMVVEKRRDSRMGELLEEHMYSLAAQAQELHKEPEELA